MLTDHVRGEFFGLTRENHTSAIKDIEFITSSFSKIKILFD